MITTVISAEIPRESSECIDALLCSGFTRSSELLPTAPSFGHTRDRSLSAIERMYGRIFSKDSLKGKRLLDAGSGYGVFVSQLRDEKIDAYGIDLEFVPDPRTKSYLMQGDMRQMPFKSETFDVIISTYAIFYPLYGGINPLTVRQVLMEILRVLKPGGELIAMPVDTKIFRQVIDAMPEFEVKDFYDSPRDWGTAVVRVVKK